LQFKKSPICSNAPNIGGLRRNASPVCKRPTVVRRNPPYIMDNLFLVLPYIAVRIYEIQYLVAKQPKMKRIYAGNPQDYAVGAK
jgi:hypothetical protein